MKHSKFIQAVVAVALLAVIQSARADTPQQKWVGDVPIMSTLTVEKGLGFAFDNVDGRIVTIYLSGSADTESVMAYYDAALEPLGWKKQSPMRWMREKEILAITSTTAAGIPLWKITLRPQ